MTSNEDQLIAIIITILASAMYYFFAFGMHWDIPIVFLILGIGVIFATVQALGDSPR